MKQAPEGNTKAMTRGNMDFPPSPQARIAAWRRRVEANR